MSQHKPGQFLSVWCEEGPAWRYSSRCFHSYSARAANLFKRALTFSFFHALARVNVSFPIPSPPPHIFIEPRRAMLHTWKAHFVLLKLKINFSPRCTKDWTGYKDVTLRRHTATQSPPSAILMVSTVFIYLYAQRYSRRTISSSSLYWSSDVLLSPKRCRCPWCWNMTVIRQPVVCRVSIVCLCSIRLFILVWSQCPW